MAKAIRSAKSTLRLMAQKTSNYKQIQYFLGFTLVLISVLAVMLTQNAAWAGLGMLGFALLALGIILQLRQIANLQRTRSRKSDIASSRLSQIERKVNLVEDFEKLTSEFQTLNDSLLGKSRRFQQNHSTGNTTPDALPLPSPEELTGLPTHLKPLIKTVLKHTADQRVLFIGPIDDCNAVERLSILYPELKIDVFPILQHGPQVISKIKQYSTVLIWLPEDSKVSNLIPFSWISNSETNIYVGPAKKVEYQLLSKVNHGSPVNFLLRSEHQNFVAIQIVRSLEG